MKSLHLFVMTCLLILTASVSAVEQITYYHSDASGSPIAATDDSGNLLWDQAYDAWGVPIPSVSGDPRGFTGASRDSDTGLSDLQARWYSPELGRMLAMDPVSFHEDNIQSFNLYAYGNNNPYRYVDPNGESPIEVFTELAPAAGRSFAALAAYGVGLATGDVYLQNTAMEAMSEMRTENLMAIASIYAPPGVGRAAKLAEQSNKIVQKSEKADFIVDSRGTAVRNSPSGARNDLEAGGYRGEATTETLETGTLHRNVPGIDGPMDVRIMDGQSSGRQYRGPRIRTTRAGTNDGVRSDGTLIRNNESKAQRHKESHIHFP